MDNLEFLRGILLQTRYRQSPEAVAVRTAVLLAARSIPVLCSADTGEDPMDMPVGSVAYVLDGLRRRGAAEPAVLNYPPALRPYLHRNVWLSTLGQERGSDSWVKGAGHDKPFTPGLATRPDLQALDPDCQVLASEPVRWLCEWRCYVAGGRLLWRERYDPDGADDTPDLSPSAIDEMIAAYESDGMSPAGYALDVGVLSDGRTALVEVNDGYALGYYGRVSPARACSYLDLLAARYAQMLF